MVTARLCPEAVFVEELPQLFKSTRKQPQSQGTSLVPDQSDRVLRSSIATGGAQRDYVHESGMILAGSWRMGQCRLVVGSAGEALHMH